MTKLTLESVWECIDKTADAIIEDILAVLGVGFEEAKPFMDELYFRRMIGVLYTYYPGHPSQRPLHYATRIWSRIPVFILLPYAEDMGSFKATEQKTWWVRDHERLFRHIYKNPGMTRQEIEVFVAGNSFNHLTEAFKELLRTGAVVANAYGRLRKNTTEVHPQAYRYFAVWDNLNFPVKALSEWDGVVEMYFEHTEPWSMGLPKEDEKIVQGITDLFVDGVTSELIIMHRLGIGVLAYRKYKPFALDRIKVMGETCVALSK